MAIGDNIKQAENKKLLENPKVQAMLRTIAYAEGADYNTRIGGGTFDDLSKKPGKSTYLKSLGLSSTAEGRYQFLNKTWDGVSKDLGLTDFSPLSQDLAAVELIKRRGALDDVINGNFDTAVNKLSKEWASLPTASGKSAYGQRARSMDSLRGVYGGGAGVGGSKYSGFNLDDYRLYIPPNDETTPTVAVKEEDSPEETAAKENIKKISAEQQLMKDYFESTTAQQTTQQPQKQSQQQPQEAFASIGDQYAQVSQFVDTPLAQEGGLKQVDIYGNPITTKMVNNSNINRTYYDPRTNITHLEKDFNKLSEEEKAYLIAHENRHAWQVDNNRTNYQITHNPDYAFNERLQKKPQIPTTGEVYWNYHDRKPKEQQEDLKIFKEENPQFTFIPKDLLDSKFQITEQQYNNPNSLEGEAEYYSKHGITYQQEGGIPICRKGGNIVDCGCGEESLQEGGKKVAFTPQGLGDFGFNKTGDFSAGVGVGILPEDRYIRANTFFNKGDFSTGIDFRKDAAGNTYRGEASYITPQGGVEASYEKNPFGESNLHYGLTGNKGNFSGGVSVDKDSYGVTPGANLSYNNRGLSANVDYKGLKENPYVSTNVGYNRGGLDLGLGYDYNKNTGSNINASARYVFEQGGFIDDNMGQWAHPGQKTRINSPHITMKGVNYPVMGISQETGEQKIMMPNLEYYFDKTKNVLEIPLMQEAGMWGKNVYRPAGTIDPLTGMVITDESRPASQTMELPEDVAFAVDLPGVIIEGRPKKTTNEFTNVKVTDERLEGVTVRDEIPNNPNYTTQKLATQTIPKIDADKILAEIKKKEEEAKTRKTVDLTLDNITEDDYAKLSPEQKAQINRELADKAPQKLLSAKGGKQQVEQVQKLLINSGYDLGKYGKNRDGVDGVAGSLTKKAVEDYNLLKGEEAFKEYKRESFLNDSKPNKDFFYMNSDEDIKKVQDNYRKQGFFNPNLKDFNLDFSGDSLGHEEKKFDTNYIKAYGKDKCEYGKECATFVTMDVLNNLKSNLGNEAGAKLFADSNVRGSAWEMPQNVIEAGGKQLYSVFEKTKPNLKSGTDVKRYVEGRLKSTAPADISQFKVGDVATMYYEKSSNFKKAYDEGGNNFSTHIGIIKEDKNGNKYVEHNVHEKIIRTPLAQAMKGTMAGNSKLQLTGVVRPQYNLQDTAPINIVKSSSPNKIDFNHITNANSPLLKENLSLLQEGIVRNKKVLTKDIPISDSEFNNLEKAVVSIAWKESYGNENVDTGTWKKAGANVLEKVGGREMSRGFTQLKDDKNLTPGLKKALLQSDTDLTDPKKSGIASFYSLSSKYLYLKDVAKNTGANLSQAELIKLSILSWNEDVKVVGDSIGKYKNFNTIMNKYRTDESTGKVTSHPYDKALNLYEKGFVLNNTQK